MKQLPQILFSSLFKKQNRYGYAPSRRLTNSSSPIPTAHHSQRKKEKKHRKKRGKKKEKKISKHLRFQRRLKSWRRSRRNAASDVELHRVANLRGLMSKLHSLKPLRRHALTSSALPHLRRLWIQPSYQPCNEDVEFLN